MRILQVRFKNLNSLLGEWQIDLSHPAFTEDGIFAITGPTGAGKTTILDAICLALYGRTPRLDKIGKSANEIMSRQTGECFAEVTFETQEGRFRCLWSQHRAHKKPDGELQNPKQEITNADSGRIFESKIKEVAKRIESVTGMNFDRFTRSMLLAQGDFAIFLQAAAVERAPILEQITGTEIYSQISIRVHQRRNEEREKLRQLQAETMGIMPLEAEEEKKIHEELAQRQAQETHLNAQSADTNKAIAWLKAMEALEKEIGQLNEERALLQKQKNAFQPERNQLDQALRAIPLDADYARLSAIRKEQGDDQAALNAVQESLPARQAAADQQSTLLHSATQRLAAAKEALLHAIPLMQSIRSLDQRLMDQQKAIAKLRESCRKDATKIDADQQIRLQEAKKRSEAQTALNAVHAYLTDHAKDEWLLSGLAGIEEQARNLLAREKEKTQKETAQQEAIDKLSRSAQKLNAYTAQRACCEQKCKEAAQQLQHGKERLASILNGRLLREYRAEKETLLRERAFLARIAELETHRAQLEDGKACPLCGAKEHPFARGNAPTASADEQKIETLGKLISAAEDQEAALPRLAAMEAEAREHLTRAEHQQVTAAYDQQTAEQALNALRQEAARARTECAELRQALANTLQPLGMTLASQNDSMPPLAKLRGRLNSWQSQIQKRTESEKRIAELDSTIKHLDGIIETQQSALLEKEEALRALRKEYDAADENRKKQYGDKHPDTEESLLNKTIAEAEEAEKKARERHDAQQQRLQDAKTQQASLHERVERRKSRLKEAEAALLAALAAAGFADEKRFLAARLAPEHREVLSARAKELAERETELKIRLDDRHSRLAAETAKQLTEQSLADLQAQAQTQENALQELRGILAGLRHRLDENAIALERIKTKQAAVEAQQKECRRWENLHQLIGSADGKKYRNFAQGLTFEIMIAYANRQLQKLTDRYLLTRDATQPLELNVIDTYQAGEIRSTKNLSGGESFIVSLALALGLSHMAGKNVRVDSLFLDEGFGTLDAESLDTALETLAGLRLDGKMIGVISHVPIIKERISARIQVLPQSGGRSRISGPACLGPGSAQSLGKVS